MSKDKDEVKYVNPTLVNTPIDYDNLIKKLGVDAAFITPEVTVTGDKDIYNMRKHVNQGMNKAAKQIIPAIVGTAAIPILNAEAIAAAPVLFKALSNPAVKYAFDASKNFGRTAELLGKSHVAGNAGRALVGGALIDIGYETITGKPAQLGEALDIQNPYLRFGANMFSPGMFVGGGIENSLVPSKKGFNTDAKNFVKYLKNSKTDKISQKRYVIQHLKDAINNYNNSEHPDNSGIIDHLINKYRLLSEQQHLLNLLAPEHDINTIIRVNKKINPPKLKGPTIYEAFERFRFEHPNLSKEEAFSEFIEQQSKFTRGVIVDKQVTPEQTQKLLDDASSEITGKRLEGGDSLNSGGGLYVSNSNAASDNYSNVKGLSDTKSKIGQIITGRISPTRNITSLNDLAKLGISEDQLEYAKYIINVSVKNMLKSKNSDKIIKELEKIFPVQQIATVVNMNNSPLKISLPINLDKKLSDNFKKQFDYVQRLWNDFDGAERAYYGHLKPKRAEILTRQIKDKPEDMIDKRGRWGRESPRSDGNFVFTEFDHETLNNMIRDYLQQFGIKMSNSNYLKQEILDDLNLTRSMLKYKIYKPKTNKILSDLSKYIDTSFFNDYLYDPNIGVDINKLMSDYDIERNYLINLYKNAHINPYSYNTAITYPFINIFNSQHKNK